MIEVGVGRREATWSPSAPSRAGASLRLRRVRPSPWRRADVAGAGIEVRDGLQPDLDGPHAVSDFFEADVVAGERSSEKDHVLPPAHSHWSRRAAPRDDPSTRTARPDAAAVGPRRCST